MQNSVRGKASSATKLNGNGSVFGHPGLIAGNDRGSSRF